MWNRTGGTDRGTVCRRDLAACDLCMGDEKLPKLTVAAEEGPLKEIHTSEENSLLYEDVMQDMEDLQLTREDKLFVVGIAPWMYLNTEAECAAILHGKHWRQIR